MRPHNTGGSSSADAARRVKIAKVAGVCVIAVLLVVVVAILRPRPQVVPALVTLACAGQTTGSLTAAGEVEDVGSANVLRRGFLYQEGTEGNPAFEVVPITNPSFEAPNPLHRWDHVHQCTPEASTERVKAGSVSAQITSLDGEWGRFGMNDPIPFEQAAGRTFTFAAWVWTDQPDRVRLRIIDRAPDHGFSLSPFHPGDGQWHWLSVTKTIRSEELSRWEVVVQHTEGDDLVYYMDGAILAEGSGIGVVFDDGEFGTGRYSAAITDLKPDTQYRVRAFAENDAGVGYGNTVVCRTAA